MSSGQEEVVSEAMKALGQAFRMSGDNANEPENDE
jgi:hypothetical protein